MNFARHNHNLVIQPNGDVLAIGGTVSTDTPANAVLPAESWNPSTGAWTTLAAMTDPRMYHSTALLLPDARVLSAGGDNFFTAQVFSPPDLFVGARPTVSSAPSTAFYNQVVTVGTPDGATIQSVGLLRLGSVTHGFNQAQRYVPLAFGQTTGGLSVTIPSDPNIVPPGHYMLFLVRSSGAPSIAPIVQVRGCG